MDEVVGFTLDPAIQRYVMDELAWEPRVDATAIGVTVEDGLVTLSGHVRSLPEKWAAEQAAKRVTGVRAVINAVAVDLGDGIRSDTDIARTALNALAWDVSVPDEAITVTVSDGWVTLEGEVAWQYQKVSAERTVGQLAGVRGITNLVHVKPLADAGAVTEQITRALQRRAALDVQQIAIQTRGHTVLLSGIVSTWAEWEAVEQAAWAAPGVTDVENRVVVTG